MVGTARERGLLRDAGCTHGADREWDARMRKGATSGERMWVYREQGMGMKREVIHGRRESMHEEPVLAQGKR